jgi:hypothetical protein
MTRQAGFVIMGVAATFATKPTWPGLGVELDRDAIRNYQTDVREFRA